ncbi:MAG: twin-arginine translocase TatA/TatE family subunit [Aquihabitans sp.]
MPAGPEIVVILLVALIVLGPDQLPKAMRTLGQALAELRKVSSGFQTEMRNVMDTIDSTAKETIGTKTPSSTSEVGSSSPSESGVEEVSARNDSRGASATSSGAPEPESASATTDQPPSTSGPSAADRAAG